MIPRPQLTHVLARLHRGDKRCRRMLSLVKDREISPDEAIHGLFREKNECEQETWRRASQDLRQFLTLLHAENFVVCTNIRELEMNKRSLVRVEPELRSEIAEEYLRTREKKISQYERQRAERKQASLA